MVTDEEYKNLNDNLKATRERVKGNRKEALRVLQAAGIVTKDGKLAEQYGGEPDK